MHKEIALSRGVVIMSTDGMVVRYIKSIILGGASNLESNAL